LDNKFVKINLDITKQTFELLEEIYEKKDLSIISIIKFFIGKGIRDLEPELANKSAVERFRNRKKLK
jgi:hypothetical protein